MGGACGACERQTVQDRIVEFEIPASAHMTTEDRLFYIIKIQKTFRGFLARKRVERMRLLASRHFRCDYQSNPYRLT